MVADGTTRGPGTGEASPPTPFAVALQRAVHDSGLSLDRLVARLARRGHRIGTTTLSNWQTGRTTPTRTSSLRALSDLETILALPAGSLRGLLAPTRAAEQLVPSADGLHRLRHRIGEDRLGAHETLSLEETHTIGPGRRPVEHRTRQVVRPRHGPVAAYYYLYMTHDGQRLTPDPEPEATVTALTGCRIGEVLREPPDLACCELLFDHAVRPGETHLFEYATTFRYDVDPPPEFRRALSRPLQEMLLRVRFDPADPPAAVESCTWADPEGEPSSRSPLRLDDRAETHVLFSRPSAGVYGLRWSWPG